MRVFLDTDIGDDVDDVLALAMLLESPEVELIGISTVHGEVEIRSRIAAKMLAVYGRADIPVHTGHGQPYNKVPRTGWAQAQGRVVQPDEHFDNLHEGNVADFILETLAAAGDPVTVVAIGPLTNLARTLERHPQAARHIEQICLMGGSADAMSPEYNIQMDPEAARIVFDSGLPLRVVPFNITHSCLMREDLLALLRGSGLAEHRLLTELIDLWREIDGRDIPVLHDPLAIGVLLRPELYRFEPMRVEVELAEPELRGATRCTADPASHTLLCTGVDYEEFHELMHERISSQCRT